MDRRTPVRIIRYNIINYFIFYIIMVLTSVLLAQSLKAKSILSIPMFAQSAALALMFVLLRQSISASNLRRRYYKI